MVVSMDPLGNSVKSTQFLPQADVAALKEQQLRVGQRAEHFYRTPAWTYWKGP